MGLKTLMVALGNFVAQVTNLLTVRNIEVSITALGIGIVLIAAILYKWTR